MDYLNKLEETAMTHIYRKPSKTNNLVNDIAFLAESAPGANNNRKMKGAARYAAKRARLDALKAARTA